MISLHRTIKAKKSQGDFYIRGDIEITKRYYDGVAHEIYRETWDEDNHHLGIFDGNLSFSDASKKANENLLSKLEIDENSNVLDIGSGFGGLPRFIAGNVGCCVIGLNLSRRENDYARDRNREVGLNHLIDVIDGDFNDIPFKDEFFDIAVSQDAMLHSPDKRELITECARVLKKKGRFIFSDILNTGLSGEEERIANERINAPYLGTFDLYREYLIENKFRIDEISNLGSLNVEMTYRTVRNNLIEKREFLEDEKDIPSKTIENTLKGLKFWVDKAREEKIGWGLFVAVKD